MSVSRRTVLAGAAGVGLTAGAAVALSACGHARDSDIVTADVIVVGAGLSGLCAARELVRRGKKTVVLEARDRVGGRMVRKSVAGDGWIDLGGQWIGPTQTDILALADSLGIKRFDSYTTGKTVVDYGGVAATVDDFPPTTPLPNISAADIAEANRVWDRFRALAATANVERPWLTSDAAALDAQTVTSWVSAQATSEFARFVVNNWVREQEGGDPGATSMLFALASYATGPDEDKPEQWLFEGGAGQIPERLATELGDRVHLQRPVRRIEQGDREVSVRTSDGGYRADSVIVAIPPYLAGAIDYDPPLPARRLQFTQRAPMGATIKCAAVYPTAWWREKGLSGGVVSDRTVLLTADSSPPNGTPGIMTAFVIGPAAIVLGEKSAEVRKQTVVADLVAYFGEEAANPVQFVEMNWPAEKWTGGAYNAVLAPNTLTSYGPAMAQPVGKIHWAGTEASPHWTGYFEGAIRAGYNAAHAVLANT